jgi:predicted Zn-dependent protease
MEAKKQGFFRQAALKRSTQEGEIKLKEAIVLGNKRKYQESIAILEEIICEYEGPPQAFLYLGRALHAAKNYSRALAAFNDYISMNPRSAEGYFFAGRTALVLGFCPRAVQYLEKALKLDKKNSSIMAMLGTALLHSRRSEAAVEILQKAVEAAPEDTRIYRAYINALYIRAIRLSRGGNYELALQMLKFVLDNGKDGPLLRLELGRISRELGLPEEAAQHYTHALQFSPNDPMIRWYRSSIYLELGKKIDAIEDISFIRSQGANVPDLPWNTELADRFIIYTLLEEGHWRRAADACRDWLKKRNAEPEIHAMYAEAQRNLKNFTAAENHLRRALEATPVTANGAESLHLWYALMLTAWEGRNLKTLKKALYTAKKLGGDKDILSRFSILYETENSDDIDRVITLTQKAIHTMGPEPELMYALGKAYLEAGLLEAAESWFSKTFFIRSKHEEARLGMIAVREVFFSEGKPKAADALAAAYHEYLELWPDNRAIRRDEALFLVKICEYETAAKKLEALLAWDPANPGLRRVLAYSYRKLGKFRQAAVYLRALLKEKPNDIRLLLEYCGCIERSGSSQYAKMILEKATNFFPASTEIPSALGIMAYREGNLERAFTHLREAASRDKNDPKPYLWMCRISQKKGDLEGAQRYNREYQRILKK